jgi:hypothetical protein
MTVAIVLELKRCGVGDLQNPCCCRSARRWRSLSVGDLRQSRQTGCASQPFEKALTADQTSADKEQAKLRPQAQDCYGKGT